MWFDRHICMATFDRMYKHAHLNYIYSILFGKAFSIVVRVSPCNWSNQVLPNELLDSVQYHIWKAILCKQHATQDKQNDESAHDWENDK